MTLLEIPYKPNLGQRKFHESQAQNRIWIGGRQAGKTWAGSREAIKLSIIAGPDSIGFVVAPTYWHTRKCWDQILRALSPHFSKLVKKVNRQPPRHIILKPNRYIWFKSADNPDSLRSERLDWAWLDECAMIKEEAYHAIEPALMGPAIYTSTPKGHNWVFDLWTRGQDPLQPDFDSWTYPTRINPYYPHNKIDDAKRRLPDLVFRQEYLGEFLPDIGAIFRNVREHIRDIPLQSQEHHRYVVGADLAKTEDFTVLVALDTQTGELHGFDRFSELDWVFQRRRILQFCHQYNSARLLIDSTGVGDPVFDELRRQNIAVDGYKFTLGTKADLIENLSLMMDNVEITYPEIPELISELRMFGYETGRTGTIRYRAPEGYHDDTVIALALAAWQLKRPEAWVKRIEW